MLLSGASWLECSVVFDLKPVIAIATACEVDTGSALTLSSGTAALLAVDLHPGCSFVALQHDT